MKGDFGSGELGMLSLVDSAGAGYCDVVYEISVEEMEIQVLFLWREVEVIDPAETGESSACGDLDSLQ